jgi:hypothetical protein
MLCRLQKRAVQTLGVCYGSLLKDKPKTYRTIGA